MQLGAAAVDVADVTEDSARAARACGTNRAIETQKGAAVFMVASVGGSERGWGNKRV